MEDHAMKRTDHVVARLDVPEPSAKIAKVRDINDPYTLSRITFPINLFYYFEIF